MRLPFRKGIFYVEVLPFAMAAILIVVSAWIGETSAVWAQSKTKVNPMDGLTYVWIPPGTFQMGCSQGDTDCKDDEKPAHSVTLTKGFWIGQTLVTQRAFRKVVGYNPSHFEGEQRPVDAVFWMDAANYCRRVDMRLPTEAEWEYAARAGTTGSRYGELDAIAWYSGNAGQTTHPVGQKLPNANGLYDMLGNEWEWVADWYGRYSPGPVADPKGATTADDQVLRGGSWVSGASGIRVSARGRYIQGTLDSVGIRCAGD